MRRVFSIVFILLGIGGILMGLSFLRENQETEAVAGAFVEDVLPQLMELSPEPTAETPAQENTQETIQQETQPQEPIIILDGRSYLGTLEFPSLELTLPVLAQYSDEDVKLAPCRYSGTQAGGDIIIAGHNYARHFHYVSGLGVGEKFLFTDGNGTVFQYKIVRREVLDGTAVEEMLSGDWDMTLFTCTYGGKGRVALRCNVIS